LLWFGITDIVVHPHPGWSGLTITVTRPDGTTETLGLFTTDTTGGTGTVYVPNMEGTYYFQVHFPEQIQPYQHPTWEYAVPAGTVMKASSSEQVSLTVTEEQQPLYPGVPLPTEYWTRPINAQFREWSSIAGSWLQNIHSVRPTSPHSQYNPYTEAPDTAHVLWRKQDIMGGLVGGEFGSHGFDDGTAYESKFSAFIIGGILYRNVPWPARSHYQGIRAIDLKTGEELWFKEGVRMAFGQLMYWDTFNMHGVFAYLWETVGSTWRAYDAYSGEWWYTMNNVPSGHMIMGPNGELLIYTVDLERGWMTLWNSSNIPALRGYPVWEAPDYNFYYASWHPYGKTVDATTGYMWNKTIPAGLPGTVAKIRGEVLLGWNSNPLGSLSDPLVFWALSLKTGQEGQQLFKKEHHVPGNKTWLIRDASFEDNIFVVAEKETRQWYGYSLTSGEKVWGPTESQPVLDWVGFGETWWPDVIADGRLYSGSFIRYRKRSKRNHCHCIAKDFSARQQRTSGGHGS
jgi:hypothetical protein